MIFLHNPPSFKASCEPSPLKWRSFGLWAAISLCGCPWILLGFGFFFRSKSRSATQLVGVTWRFHKHLQPMAWNMKQQDRDNGNAKKQRTVNGIYIYIYILDTHHMHTVLITYSWFTGSCMYVCLLSSISIFDNSQHSLPAHFY